MTPRLAVTLAAAAIAAAALASPAAAVMPALSASQITSPSDPAYAFGEHGSSAHAITVAGTTTGSPTATVDLKCYPGSGSVTTLKANVATSGNAFSVNLTSADIWNASPPRPCVLRAVTAGDTSAHPPSAGSDPFQGPRLAVTYGDTYTDSSTSQLYDFYYFNQGARGAFQFNSAESGIAASFLYDPSTLAPTPSFIGAANAFNGGDLIKVDGTDSFVPDSAIGSPGWFGITDLHTSFDPTTGNLVVQDREPLSKDSNPWNGSYVPSGVELDRTWTSDSQGRVAHLVDSWRSTDGQQHTIQLKYESFFATTAAGNTLNFPGSSGYQDYAQGDSVPLPSGPGTVYFKYDGATPDAGDGTNPQGAVTYPEAPDGPATIEYKNASGIGLLMPYTRTIPAGGSTTLRFTWSQAFALSDLQSFAQQAQASYAPKVTPNPPANGPQPPVTLPPSAHQDTLPPGLSLVGGIHTTGNGFSFTLTCANGPCPGGATLTTTELVKSPGSKLLGLSAARTKRKKVTVGSTRFTIASGARKTITVKLSGAGQKLLAKFKKLPAKLTIALNGKPTITKTVALKTKKRH